MKRKRIVLIIIYLILLLPLWLWLSWFFWPEKPINIVIVDKTVLTPLGNEHNSLNWVLMHEKYFKSKGNPYRVANDYFGFYPLDNKEYRLKGLEIYDTTTLNTIAQSADMAYFTDTYGVYNNEWFGQKDEKEHSGYIYGGMSKEDMFLIRKLKAQKKLVLAEFNTIGSPTIRAIRSEFEDLYNIKWTGWIGRYFASLDTSINKELPHWLTIDYRKQHADRWPFTKSGIAFVHEDGKVEVLEYGKGLDIEVPHIITEEKESQLKFDVTKDIKYPYWFDIMYTKRSNYVVSQYVIYATSYGDSILTANNIPKRFPAVIAHEGDDYKFYYFCGDFCDNPIAQRSAYFKGIEGFSPLLYNPGDPGDRKGFFWEFYRPMITSILDDYYAHLKRK
jgi:hypothetical protein